MMKYANRNYPNLILFFVAIICFGTTAFAQNDCGNVGFEYGNNTGWTGYIGTCSTGPVNPVGSLPSLNISTTPTTWTTPQNYLDPNEFIPTNRWAILGPTDGVNGFDDIIPTIPVVSPWGGTRSVKLGNTGGNHNAERLRYHYTVDANNYNFVYQYAVILQSPSHETYEMPAFRVKFTNAAGAIINPTCGVYNVFGGQSNVGFTNVSVGGDSVSYRNWSLVSLDLSPFIGQTITIEFTTNDCIFAVHYGYAYIDMTCVPLELVTSYCSGSPTADVTAPDGYVSYSWNADAVVNYPPITGPPFPIGSVLTTNQTLIVPSIDTTTTYTVSIIPYQGAQCAATLSYQFNPTPTLTAAFNYQAYCGNTASQFQEAAIIAANASPPTSWNWDFGDGGTSTSQNPSHFYPVLPNDVYYPVSLIVYAGASCKDTIHDTILVPSGLTFDTLLFNNVTCGGADNGQISIKVSGSPNSIYTTNWVIPSAPPQQVSQDTIYSQFGLQANSATSPNIPLYWFKAYDISHGCYDSLSFTITEPPPLTVSVATQYISCHGASGNLQAIVNGGTLPYTFDWSTPTNEPNAIADSIPAGTYNLTVKDANQCEKSTIGVLIDGSELHYRLHTSDISCHGFADGTSSIKLFDGQPSYKITWHINGIVKDTVADTSYFSHIKRDNGFVIIHNSNGCLDDTIAFSILEPDTMQAIITTTNSSCEIAKNGAIKVDAAGGVGPYTYLWSTDHDKTKQGVKDLYFGADTVVITDANNCIFTQIGYIDHDSDFVVQAIPDFVYDMQADNSLLVTVNKPGTYTYQWSNGSVLDDSTIANPMLDELFFPEEFRVDVVDEFGCIGFDSVFVDVVPLAYFPTAFTPNGDGLNDTLSISFSERKVTNFNLDIYDRWGGKVFNAKQPNFKWDGKKDNQNINIGVYNYYLSYTDNRKKLQKITGTISLLR